MAFEQHTETTSSGSAGRVIELMENPGGTVIAGAILAILSNHEAAYVPAWGLITAIEKAGNTWSGPWVAYSTDGAIIVEPFDRKATNSLTGDPLDWPKMSSLEPWDDEAKNDDYDPPDDGNGNGNGNGNGAEPAIPFGVKVAAGVAVGLFLLRK
jgi:hypothetical protein